MRRLRRRRGADRQYRRHLSRASGRSSAEILAGGAIPVILGGDHGITWPSATAVADALRARHGRHRALRRARRHRAGHARARSPGTAPRCAGSIESGAVPGRNFVQVGLRGYWPDPPVAGLDGGARDAHPLHGRDPRATASTRCSNGRCRRGSGHTPTTCTSRSTSTCADPAYRARHRHAGARRADQRRGAAGGAPPGRRGRHRRHGRGRGQPAVRRGQQHHRAVRHTAA